MTKVLFIFMLLWFSSDTQTPTLKAVFEREIISRHHVEFEGNVTTKEDSILNEFAQHFFNDAWLMTLVFDDSVEVYEDRTIVHSVYRNLPNSMIQFQISDPTSVITVRNGRLYDEGGRHMEKMEPILFTATDKTENVSGYDSRLYLGDNGKVKIWVCESLPSGLNPGIPIANNVINGGIVRYEGIEKDQQINIVLKQIIK